jgi:chromosome segregation ATPase
MMLFGKGGRSEQVALAELPGLLDLSFDKKLGTFERKAAKIMSDLSHARRQFDDALAKFERLDVEPDIENFYLDNSSFIKSQKGFYTKALRHIASDWNTSMNNTQNIYGKYSTELTDADRFIREVLRTNNNFKKVLHSYSNHLDSFRNSFSMIERVTNSLRNELGRVSNELSEFNVVSESIQKLALLKDEYNGINSNIGVHGLSSVGIVDSDELKVSEEISKKESELNVVKNEASELAGRINSITTPLERSSRKLDHGTARKRQLGPFMADPIRNISNESDYMEFISLVNELKKSIDSGTIDVKNNTRAGEIVYELLRTDIYSMIVHFRELEGRILLLNDEISSSQIALSRMRENRSRSEKAIHEVKNMKEKASDIDAALLKELKKVEELFLKYYNRAISITPDWKN